MSPIRYEKDPHDIVTLTLDDPTGSANVSRKSISGISKSWPATALPGAKQTARGRSPTTPM
jgi:hypothetical protein